MSPGAFLLWAWTPTATAERYAFDDGSGSITFDMVASLHDVNGEARTFSGALMLDTPSPTGAVTVQANRLTTGLDVRDRRMFTYCLSVDQYPTIDFKIAATEGDINGLNARRGSGQITLRGQLTIRAASRDVTIPATYTWEGETLRLTGDHQIKWTDYGVPDPSIIISTLYPELNFHFDVQMKATP